MSKDHVGALARVWYFGAAAICALLVVATALQVLVTQSGPAARLLNHLTLSWENNLGAWWSGMLLAVVSLHAFDGYVRLRGSKPLAARGWSMLAAVLLFLSFDEVGSLHERLGDLGGPPPLREWSLLLPLGAVLGAMCLRALALLWQADGERWKVWSIGAGLFLLSSAAPQEFLEHRIHWQTDAAKAIRAAMEEGTELLGMLVLLRVAMANTAELAYGTFASGRTAFAALHELRRPLVAIGLALAPALALGTSALPDQILGHPADWLAAVAFLAAGLVLCRPLLIDDRGVATWETWLAGGLCCLGSVTAVAISPLKVVGLGPVHGSLRMLVLMAISIMVAAAWSCLQDGRGRSYAVGAVVAGALAAALLPLTNLVLLYYLSQLLGVVVYWANSGVVQEAERGRASPLHVSPT
jgi:hypothetical protein